MRPCWNSRRFAHQHSIFGYKSIGGNDRFTFIVGVAAKHQSGGVCIESGDARGAALLLENVSVYRGPNQVIKGIDWRVEPRTKWALVGSNGAGKSSLLKAIADEVPFDGKIVIGAKEQVGYLQQTAVAEANEPSTKKPRLV